jgi:hypothetical protein
MMKSKRKRWARTVARMEETNATIMLLREPEGMETLILKT